MKKVLLGYIWSLIIQHAYKSYPFNKSAVTEKIAEVVRNSGFCLALFSSFLDQYCTQFAQGLWLHNRSTLLSLFMNFLQTLVIQCLSDLKNPLYPHCSNIHEFLTTEQYISHSMEIWILELRESRQEQVKVKNIFCGSWGICSFIKRNHSALFFSTSHFPLTIFFLLKASKFLPLKWVVTVFRPLRNPSLFLTMLQFPLET